MTQLSLLPLTQALVRLDMIRQRRASTHRYCYTDVALNRHLQRDIGIVPDKQDALPISTQFAAKRYLVTWRRRWRWL